jgi:hypothetical protein
MKKRYSLTTFLIILQAPLLFAQPVPASDENIPYLVTFGKQGSASWGDINFSQVFFFVVPQSQVSPVYIRVYDPDTGGDIDEQKGAYNTTTAYTIYGGKEAFTHKDARRNSPEGNFKSGNMLASKSFGVSEVHDKGWYTFGPFNPREGELVPEYGGYIFKVITEGVSGDDGNLYRYFLSVSPDENKPVEGANSFTFEYTFRLSDNAADVSHIYPFIDSKVISIKISDFDHDNDGMIKIVSAARRGEISKVSGDNDWTYIEHKIMEDERNSSLDIQFIKNKTSAAKNNNITLSIANQYGELLPFYVVPIGGVPKYKYKIGVKPK